MKLIDKDKVVAEIEKRIKGLKDCHADTVEGYAGEISGLKRLLSFLDTLETKEVDLDEEFDKYCGNLYLIDLENEPYAELFECAKHFYELGLKARE